MQRRWIVHIVIAVQAGAIVAFALRYNALDFFIYRLGGAAGADLYTRKLADHWFTYTPFAATVFKSLNWVPLIPARVAWELASVAAFAVACRTALQLGGWQASRRVVAVLVAAGLVLEPVWHTFFLGQINLLLLGLVLVDVRRAALGRTAGAGIGVAAAIKLTPGIFLVFLLLAGRVRAAATAAGTVAVATLIGFLVAPGPSRLYWTQIFYDTRRVGIGYISNQSPYGAAVRILGGRDAVGHWFALVTLALAAGGLAVAVCWARRGDWLRAIAATGLTGLLTSPISWSHHWVWALPTLVVLFRDARRGWFVAGYLLLALAPMWWTPKDGSPREYGWHGLLTLAANAYLIAGLAALAWLGAGLVQRRAGLRRQQARKFEGSEAPEGAAEDLAGGRLR